MPFHRPKTDLPPKILGEDLNPVSLSGEIRFILQAAKLFLYPETEASPVPPALDWNRVLAAAQWHRLDAILYRVLLEHYPEAAPETAMKQLEERYRRYAHKGLVLTARLNQILKDFKKHNLPVLQLKGITLAQLAYGDLALRPCLDLDLLVKPEDLPLAISRLEALGFKRATPLPEHAEAVQTRIDYETTLSDGVVSVDLHWACARFREMFPIDLDKALESPQWVEIGGVKAPTLPMNDLIAYLSFHGARHLWMKLFWIYDLAIIAARFPQMSWTPILGRAMDLRQARTLLHGKLLARELFDAALPHTLESYTPRDPVLPGMVSKTCRFLFDRPHPQSNYEVDFSLFQKFMGGLDMYSSPRIKGTIAFRYLCQPALADLKAARLKPDLFFLYYLLRPLRLLREQFRRKPQGSGA